MNSIDCFHTLHTFNCLHATSPRSYLGSSTEDIGHQPWVGGQKHFFSQDGQLDFSETCLKMIPIRQLQWSSFYMTRLTRINRKMRAAHLQVQHKYRDSRTFKIYWRDLSTTNSLESGQDYLFMQNIRLCGRNKNVEIQLTASFLVIKTLLVSIRTHVQPTIRPR